MWNFTKTYLLLTLCGLVVGGIAALLFDAGDALGRAVGMFVFGTPFAVAWDVIARVRYRARAGRVARAGRQ